MEPSPSAEIFAVLDSISNNINIANKEMNLIGLLFELAVVLCLLLLGWLIGWLLRAVVRRMTVRFSKRIAKRITEGTIVTPFQYMLVDRKGGSFLSQIAYWIGILWGVLMACEVGGFPVLTTFQHYLPKVIVAIAIMGVGIFAGRIFSEVVTSAAFRWPSPQGRQMARIARIAQGIIVGAAILVAINQLGVDVSLLTNIFLIVLAALLAGAAFAFGLGARSVVANILAMHYVNKSYDVGQRIRLGDDNGRIVRTTSTTVFVEHDGGELGIPGQQFFEERCLRISKEVSSES